MGFSQLKLVHFQDRATLANKLAIYFPVHIIERAKTCVQPVNIKVAQIPRDNPAHLKADLSRWEDRATFRPFLSTRAGQQTNDREEDHDTDNREVEALQK